MSRRKHQVVKLLKDAGTFEQFRLCTLGDLYTKYHPNDVEFVLDLQSLAFDPPFDICKDEAERAEMLKVHESEKVDYANKLLALFLEAFKTGSSEKLTSLVSAVAIICPGSVSPEYTWVWNFLCINSPQEALRSKAHRLAGITLAELSAAYHKRFAKGVEDPQLRKMVDAFSWKLKKDKPGPR